MMTPASTPPPQGPTLRDIHLPSAPTWWPPAPGWWVLAVLCVALALVGAWLWRRRQRRRAAEQAVLAELDALVAHWQAQPSRLATALHHLLRRAALRYDAGAGQRQGDAWRETLACVPVTSATLDRLMALESVMYRADVPFDAQASIDATRQWLREAWRRAPSRVASSVSARSASQGSAHA